MGYGANIREARRAAGLTQKQLAERLGISPVNISQLENDQRTPNLGTLERMAKALNTHVFDLTGIGKEVDECNDLIAECVVKGKDGDPLTPERMAALEESLSKEPREIYNTFSDYEKVKFWKMLMKPLRDQLNDAFDRLSPSGQQKAVERVSELTEIPRYRRQEPPQTTPGASGGKDTPTPPDAAQGPPEGE